MIDAAKIVAGLGGAENIVCIDTARLKGDGRTPLSAEGDEVEAGAGRRVVARGQRRGVVTAVRCTGGDL